MVLIVKIPCNLFVQMKRNTMELAKAIQELEASTAALQSTYDGDSSTSQHSLQCSSGYGTMNNTPAHSQDTIAMGGESYCLANQGNIVSVVFSK